MRPQRFKLILCDLGNVLINFDHRIAVRKILKFTDKSFREVYQLFFDSVFTKDFEEGRISGRDFYRRIAAELGLKKMTFEKFNSIWSDIFFDNKGILPLLCRLKKNYRLHLVSNINKLHYDYIVKKFPRHLDLFDAVILSYKVGRRKPHPSIYREATRGFSAAGASVLYIDDRADLIKEAQKLKFKTILFKNIADFKKQLHRRRVIF